MTDETVKRVAPEGRLIHLPPGRRPRRERPADIEDLEYSISEGLRRQQDFETSVLAHFKEQNEMLLGHNREQGERIQRLTNGIERLVTEMHGIRTGKKEEAFARIVGADGDPDLPTVSGEASLHYVHTSTDIGEELGFHCSQIGYLLGSCGLGWAGDPDYQEIGRSKKPGQTKWWHHSVPERLRKILDENQPERHGIKSTAVLNIFRVWEERRTRERMLDAPDGGSR